MAQQQDGTGQIERGSKVSGEELQALDRDEKIGMLFYLTGYLSKSQEFQDALTAAYNAQMRSRARLAALRG